MASTVDWSLVGGDILGDVLGAEDLGPDFGDRYEVQDCLGKGGQGTVHRAWDRVLERAVAVKALRDPGANQRPLLEEARLLGRLAHPAIPQLYDRGKSPNGGLYLVMQLIDGKRLDKYLAGKPFDLAARLRLFRAVAGAVEHAHSRGLLHRDLKPENVMVTDAGEPYLVDWGLAAHGGPRAICGSPYFAAPEQLEGQVADRRADVYALGVLLYVILTGELPYARRVSSFAEFRRQRATLAKVPLHERRRELPKALTRVVNTAIAAQPGARYQNVTDVLADIDACELGRPLARDVPTLSWRWPLLVAVVLAAFGGGWWLQQATQVAEADLAEPTVEAAESMVVARPTYEIPDFSQFLNAPQFDDPFAVRDPEPPIAPELLSAAASLLNQWPPPGSPASDWWLASLPGLGPVNAVGSVAEGGQPQLLESLPGLLEISDSTLYDPADLVLPPVLEP